MTLLLLTLVCLISTSILSGTTTALLRMGRIEGEEEFKRAYSRFFFQRFIRRLFKGKKWEVTLFSLSITKQMIRLCYATTAFFFLIKRAPFSNVFINQESLDPLWVVIIALLIIFISLFSDLIMNLLSTIKPKSYFTLFSPITSLLLTLFIPLTAPCFRIFGLLLPSLAKKKGLSSYRLREKILEILQESELSYHLDANYKKLILSVVSFKDRIAREVMVPRIDVYSLPSDMTIEEAAKSFLIEGYSRIPIYEESVDHIIGVLLYKDVLKAFVKALSSNNNKEQLQTPIENLVKPVLYTPETKKISHLLQEFRNKQIHLAIVVDEYGGTEGIVTFEDILEELVGEIADEYDVGEEVMYAPLPGGGWSVDARMSILDIENDLGIKIPPGPEYDTIGGFIYHRAGAIPSRGWRIHHEDFDLEILSSDERSIGKIRITPHIENN